MGRLTLASDVQDAISRHGDSVELTAADGRLAGCYLSPAAYQKLLCRYANSFVTEAELEESRWTPSPRSSEELLVRPSNTPQT